MFYGAVLNICWTLESEDIELVFYFIYKGIVLEFHVTKVSMFMLENAITQSIGFGNEPFTTTDVSKEK